MTMTTRYTVIDGEIIAEKRNGVRKQYVPDSQGSTVALLDNTQTPTDTFTYWPYGEVANRTGTTPTPFQFVGTLGCRQDSTGKTYVRARVLDTQTSRWLTKDPIGFDGGDWNFYRYVENNPSSFSDPTGLLPSMPGCSDLEKKRINKQIQDVCNYRIQLLPSAALRSCLKKRCGNIKIICKNDSEYPCEKNGGGVTLHPPGHPRYRQPTDTITLCRPGAFSSKKYGCLGKTLLHEMIHSCGNIDCPNRDTNHSSGSIPAGPGSTEGMAQIGYGPGTPPCPK